MRSDFDLLQFVKNCLHRIYNRQFLTFLLFLLLSASFWVFQKLNDTYEREFALRVRLVDVPSNVDITTGPPDYIHVTLRDKGELCCVIATFAISPLWSFIGKM